MELIGDTGASVIWVGEHGVRYYAHGRPLTPLIQIAYRTGGVGHSSRTRNCGCKADVRNAV